MKKFLSLALALVMLLGLLPLSAMAESTEPYWEIQIYSELANYAGLQTGWFAKLLKDKFNVMSVPCMVITRPGAQQTIEFGKKSVPQMLDLLGA